MNNFEELNVLIVILLYIIMNMVYKPASMWVLMSE